MKGIRGNIIQTMTIKFTALETCCDSYCVGSVSDVLKQFSSQILYAVQIASVVPATSCSDILYVLASEFNWLLSLWLTSVVCCSCGNLVILQISRFS
jgi:hypothetical protein